MKKTALIIAALAAAGVAYAADNVNVTTRPSYSVTSDFTYTSEYIFRGIKKTEDAFQASLEVGAEDARVGIWTNQPIDSGEESYNNEIDFYAGYKYRIDRNLSADFVATYYYYPEATDGETRNSYELGLGGTYDLGALTPTLGGISASLYYYYDFRLHQDTVQVSAGYSYALRDFGTSLDFSVFGGAVKSRDYTPDDDANPDRVFESYNYYGIGLNIPYRLAENAQAHVGANYSVNEKLMYDEDENFAFNAGITLGF